MGICPSSSVQISNILPILSIALALSYPSYSKLGLISSGSVSSSSKISMTYSDMSMGSKAMISNIMAKKIEAFAGMITFTRVKCTITCKFLIDESI